MYVYFPEQGASAACEGVPGSPLALAAGGAFDHPLTAGYRVSLFLFRAPKVGEEVV